MRLKDFGSHTAEMFSGEPTLQASRCAKILNAHAKEGAPYGLMTLAELFTQHTRQEDTTEGKLALLGQTIEVLLRKYKWQQHASFGFYAMPGSTKTTLPMVLTYATPQGVATNLEGMVKIVEILTGENTQPATMRKTISRLVQQKVFQRHGEGLYVRTRLGD